MPYDTPELKQVRAFGMTIVGEVELASRFLQGRIVAITGSNVGTTTTPIPRRARSSLTLASARWSAATSAFSSLISSPAARPRLERPRGLQLPLETIVEFRPHIAVVLNITPDHLDRHGSFENYAAAKARITENQTAEDFLVLNAEDKPTQMVAAKTRAASSGPVPRA